MSYRNDLEVDQDLIQLIDNLDEKVDEIFKYIYSHQPEIRTLIAKNRNLSAKNLNIMKDDVNIFVRASVAQNPNLDHSDVIFLSKDSNVLVVTSIAANQNLPLEIIEDFVSHESYMIRSSIATNSFIGINHLEKLSQDEIWGVRENVALNKLTPAEVLDQMAEDRIREVVEAVARNSSTSMQTLEKLSKKDNDLRTIVLENESLEESLLKEIFEEVKSDEDNNSEGTHYNYQSREIIAKRGNLSRYFINSLINDSEAGVRASLAGNKVLTTKDLEILAIDSDQSVRKAAFDNPNSNDSIKASARLLGLDNEDE